MPAKRAKRTAKSKPKKYQAVVTKRVVTHDSESDREETARNRVKQATLDAGPGARGTLFRWNTDRSVATVIYTVRCVHSGDAGTPAIVEEDDDTPPPSHEEA